MRSVNSMHTLSTDLQHCGCRTARLTRWPWRTTTRTSRSSSSLSTTWTPKVKTAFNTLRIRRTPASPPLQRTLPPPPRPRRSATSRAATAPAGWATSWRRKRAWPTSAWTRRSCRAWGWRSTAGRGGACTTSTRRWTACVRWCLTLTAPRCGSWARSPRSCWPGTTSSCSTTLWTRWRSWWVTFTRLTRPPPVAAARITLTCTVPSPPRRPPPLWLPLP